MEPDPIHPDDPDVPPPSIVERPESVGIDRAVFEGNRTWPEEQDGRADDQTGFELQVPKPGDLTLTNCDVYKSDSLTGHYVHGKTS